LLLINVGAIELARWKLFYFFLLPILFSESSSGREELFTGPLGGLFKGANVYFLF